MDSTGNASAQIAGSKADDGRTKSHVVLDIAPPVNAFRASCCPMRADMMIVNMPLHPKPREERSNDTSYNKNRTVRGSHLVSHLLILSVRCDHSSMRNVPPRERIAAVKRS